MSSLSNIILNFFQLKSQTLSLPFRVSSLLTGPQPEPLCPGSPVLKEEYESLLSHLLLTIAYPGPLEPIDPARHDIVAKQLEADGAPPELIKLMSRGAIDTGVHMGFDSYPHLSQRLREAIAVYSAIVATIDGYATELYPHLRSFGSNLLLGKPQDHDVLRLLTTWLARHCNGDYAGFGGDMIIKATTDFVCTNYFEAQATGLRGVIDCPKAAVYLRNKCGDSEVFAHFIFPEEEFPEARYLESYFPAIPYLIQYLDHINDVMSFYKEEIVGEKNNFVHIFARSENISLSDALKETFKRSVDSFQRVQDILSKDEDPRLLQAAVHFLHGYITFHVLCPRYRLGALDVPAISDAISKFSKGEN